MRTNTDLENRLHHFIASNFSDIEIKNEIIISFGRKAKRQLGSIKLLPSGASKITITAHFKDEKIPQVVVDETIIHEFVHYSHGFSSPLPQFYKHPHKHGIMRKEFEKRGLINIYSKSKKWLKNNWHQYLIEVGAETPQPRKISKRKKQSQDPLYLLLKKFRNILS